MNGKQHTQITLGISLVAGATSFIFIDPLATFFIICGGLIGVFINPDLDFAERSNGRMPIEPVRLVKKFPLIGYYLGRFFQRFWRDYGYRHKHRSFYSHFPIVGTVGRILYVYEKLAPLLLTVFLFIVFGGGMLSFSFPTTIIPFVCTGYCFIGLACSDIGHWLADGCPLA